MNRDRNTRRRLFLGVDGGATKTLAVVVDEDGDECGRGSSGSGNQESVGLETALRHINEAIAMAMGIAGAEPPAEAAWIGLAGIDRPADIEAFKPQLEPVARYLRLSNDAELALAALPDAVGIALIAGTGSIAIGRSRNGVTARVGGWGHVLGDEGSGYELGRRALQAALRAIDGRGKPTLLLDLIMQEWCLERMDDVMFRVYQRYDKAEIARLSRLVFATARSGDVVARGIVRRGASELASHAFALVTSLGIEGPVPIALGGGLFVHERAYRQLLLRRLRTRLELGSVMIVTEPSLSAALAARTLVAERH